MKTSRFDAGEITQSVTDYINGVKRNSKIRTTQDGVKIYLGIIQTEHEITKHLYDLSCTVSTLELDSYSFIQHLVEEAQRYNKTPVILKGSYYDKSENDPTDSNINLIFGVKDVVNPK